MKVKKAGWEEMCYYHLHKLYGPYQNNANALAVHATNMYKIHGKPEKGALFDKLFEYHACQYEAEGNESKADIHKALTDYCRALVSEGTKEMRRAQVWCEYAYHKLCRVLGENNDVTIDILSLLCICNAYDNPSKPEDKERFVELLKTRWQV